jgi:hypothetical protein
MRARVPWRTSVFLELELGLDGDMLDTKRRMAQVLLENNREFFWLRDRECTYFLPPRT